MESNANYAKITAGNGTLIGSAYIHNTRQVSADVSQAAEPNVVTVSDATLVSLVNSSDVAQRLAQYYACLATFDGDILPGQQLDGNVVGIYDPFDRQMVQACLKSLDIKISGTLKATVSALVGFKPPQVDDSQTLDERIVLTGSGTYQIPAGTTLIRYVLISGAQEDIADKKAGMSARRRPYPGLILRGVTNTEAADWLTAVWAEKAALRVQAPGSSKGPWISLI